MHSELFLQRGSKEETRQFSLDVKILHTLPTRRNRMQFHCTIYRFYKPETVQDLGIVILYIM